jgi:two-component system, NtrC family, sensor kinase
MKYLIIVFLAFPLVTIAQSNDILILSTKAARTTKFASGWIALDSGWKFKAGDDPDWAKPGFNDSSWQSIHLLQDLYYLPQVPKTGIVWFRLRLTADSTMNRQLVMRIYQTGASEVYLEGKLMHRLGVVSTNPDSVKFYSPNSLSLSFPVKYNTDQTLAIRFANLPASYPIYPIAPKSILQCWVTTLENANDDNIVRYYRTFNNRMNIGIGVASILCILYLSFFIFFSAQKINLYFSLSNFFFALFLIVNTININYHGAAFKYTIFSVTFTVLYLTLFLYCIYKIFNQKPGRIYWSLIIAGVIAVPAVFIIDGGLISTALAVLVLIDILRITIKSIPDNQAGAWIILIGVGIDLIYWTLNLLSGVGILNIPTIDSYSSFAILIGPLSLAIYLGYAFGMTSQSLRQKLAEVEQLSDEKQQILSSQNETLERQVRERTSALNESLNNLKATQSQLIQSEKMASLGELTAGIAHEIQNPLNFVNNFSEVNRELVEELKIKNEKLKIEDDEVRELLNDITQNLEKINHHGKRADAIVKGMLQHSRTGSGQKELTDINALCDEYLRLAYHGLRAKDKSFNAVPIAIGIKTDFDENIGKINVVPQDIGRVLLNLYNNAFYAVSEKEKNTDENYKPEVSVRTKKLNKNIEISVCDNGHGISQNIVDKIFQPFFTTKPTGQGTGLGLSLSYDIVKAHGGEIKVNTIEGEGSEFILQLSTS